MSPVELAGPPPPHYTSVPAWTREPQVEPADPTGTVHTVLEIGQLGGAGGVVDGWLAELAEPTGRADRAEREVRLHRCADVAAAEAALAADLDGARVGHRVLLAGSAESCLALRAAALRAGLVDAEIRVGVVSVDTRSVWCVHCSSSTSATVGLEDVVVCAGCRRRLLVYPHVSRLTGRHLGFMVDAEDPQ